VAPLRPGLRRRLHRHGGPGAEHEVTLREETPVVEKTTVPRERVRLGTETVTDERQVAEEVRKEQIDVDDQSGRARRPPR
jgi:stress response protein YsnF